MDHHRSRLAHAAKHDGLVMRAMTKAGVGAVSCITIRDAMQLLGK